MKMECLSDEKMHISIDTILFQLNRNISRGATYSCGVQQGAKVQRKNIGRGCNIFVPGCKGGAKKAPSQLSKGATWCRLYQRGHLFWRRRWDSNPR